MPGGPTATLEKTLAVMLAEPLLLLLLSLEEGVGLSVNEGIDAVLLTSEE